MGHLLIQESQERDYIEEIKSIVLEVIPQKYKKNPQIIEGKIKLQMLKKMNDMQETQCLWIILPTKRIHAKRL